MTYDLQQQLAKFVLTSMDMPQLAGDVAGASEAVMSSPANKKVSSRGGWDEASTVAEEDIIKLDGDFEED
jgi:hypothetical protein